MIQQAAGHARLFEEILGVRRTDNAVQVFDTVYILTKGGPGTATITPSVVLYEQGFTYRKMGYASAIGVIMFAIIMVLTVINQKLMKNTESMD